MKINYLKRCLIGIAMTAFLAILAGNAFGDHATVVTATRDFSDGGDGAYANNYMIMSPYWQVEGGGSYTFIAVSHSSLSGMASQIGVKMNAITSAGAAYATAASFTVASGETKRVFIIPTNHSTINSTNITDAIFIAGTTDFTYGHLRIKPHTTHPQLRVNDTKLVATNRGDGFRDTTMLSYWGSVIVEANTTGFAMEFIGDLNDSQTLNKHAGSHYNADLHMGSGVNLQ